MSGRGYHFRFRDSVSEGMDPLKRMMHVKERDGRKIMSRLFSAIRERLHNKYITLKDLVEGRNYGGYEISVKDFIHKEIRKEEFPTNAPEFKESANILYSSSRSVMSMLDELVGAEIVSNTNMSCTIPYKIAFGGGRLEMKAESHNIDDIPILKLDMIDLDKVIGAETLEECPSNVDVLRIKKIHNEMVNALNEWYPDAKYLSVKARNDLHEFMKVFFDDAVRRGLVRPLNEREANRKDTYMINTFVRDVLRKTCVFNSDRAFYDLYSIFAYSEKLSLPARKKLRIQLATYLLDKTEPVYSIQVDVMNGSSVEQTINGEVEDGVHVNS